jgi:acetyl esterase/lipase
MRRKLFCLAVLIVGLTITCSIGLQAQSARQQKEVAVTIQKPYLNNQKVATQAAPNKSSVQAQDPGPDKWVDFASGDYDILPNITYAVANNIELKLDLYLPRKRIAPLPTLMLFHGGGWVDGQKERNVFQLLPYLSLGWAVINVEYRVARQSPAPAAVEDCRCALRWVAYRAKEYNLDTSKIVLTGGSAGGHLALITGMLPAQSTFDRQCPTDSSTRWREGTEPKTNVAAIINWYGITDVADLIDGPNAKHYAMEWFGSMSNREELARQLSPINYVRAGMAPIITIHGDQDDIVPYNHAVRLHAALDKAGAPNQLVTLRGRGHGGFNRQELVNSYAVIREFLRKHNLLNTEQ